MKKEKKGKNKKGEAEIYVSEKRKEREEFGKLERFEKERKKRARLNLL